VRLTRSIACLLVPFVVSCATETDKSRPAESRKTLSQRLSESNGYVQDADGNWVPQNDKRSSFESQGKSAYFQGDYAKKQFQTTDYSKKSWWGNKDYKPAKYEGNTDGSRFQTASRHDGQGARETGQSAGFSNTYRTGRYGTGAARESAVSNLAKPSDAVTDRRREVFQAPEIIDYQEQRSLSLEQSKGILGR
jgi:hypothetical protein